MIDRARLRDRLALMVITDPSARIGVLPAAHAALVAGAPAIQLRWKDASTREMLGLARELRRLTRDAGALLIVNDRVDIALAVEADGAHLGDDDLPLAIARRLAGDGFVIGRSVDTPAEAILAAQRGADYVGLGPIFPTMSKDGLGEAAGVEGITAVRSGIELPIVAIGGIGAETVGQVIAAGADGAAVIGAIMSAADPGAATTTLLEGIRQARSRSP